MTKVEAKFLLRTRIIEAIDSNRDFPAYKNIAKASGMLNKEAYCCMVQAGVSHRYNIEPEVVVAPFPNIENVYTFFEQVLMLAESMMWVIVLLEREDGHTKLYNLLRGTGGWHYYVEQFSERHEYSIAPVVVGAIGRDAYRMFVEHVDEMRAFYFKLPSIQDYVRCYGEKLWKKNAVVCKKL
jgi:hypothetical protein